jgi:mannitol/fructose-specific phosphotransferase system IIA component (Ntr-type)
MTELASILHPKVIKPHLGATTRYEAMQELLDLMVYSHDLSTGQLVQAREAVFRSVRQATQGSASGAAVALANLEGISTPVAALGLSKEGIDFGGSIPSRLVLLVLSPSGTMLDLPLATRFAKERPLVVDLLEEETARSLLKKLAGLDDE